MAPTAMIPKIRTATDKIFASDGKDASAFWFPSLEPSIAWDEVGGSAGSRLSWVAGLAGSESCFSEASSDGDDFDLLRRFAIPIALK